MLALCSLLYAYITLKSDLRSSVHAFCFFSSTNLSAQPVFMSIVHISWMFVRFLFYWEVESAEPFMERSCVYCSPYVQ